MRWKLVVAGAVSLCALGVAAALLVGRGGGAATPGGSTAAATTTTSRAHYAVVDTPPLYCIEDTENGKTYLWHFSDDAQTLVRGCPGANLP